MNTAVFITGTVCSGKSTISEKIQKELNIKLINETNVCPNGILGIKHEIKTNKNNDIVLIEHVEILNIIDDIKKYIKNLFIILLNVSDNILIKNLEMRKSKNITGDYLRADILGIKKEIEKKFNNIIYGCEKYTANINKCEDYDIEYDKIIKKISIHI
jgi:cytidylate kinase